jgi:hypothetical protein
LPKGDCWRNAKTASDAGFKDVLQGGCCEWVAESF